MRNNAIRKGNYYKQGILIEGDAGLGKSTLYKALLEKNGYQNALRSEQLQINLRNKLSQEDITQAQYDKELKILANNQYFEISVGDASAHTILEKAFHSGSVVILDELNLDDSLESLLNQLLEGRDKNGHPPKSPGFMILASQNPSYEKGRVPVSQALRSRVHMIYMDSYTHEALVAIAAKYAIPFPNAKEK